MPGSACTVSVVIPCYNHGAFLEEAVDSVLAQTFDDFEIVVVDDGSSDPGTCELLDTFQRPRTRVLRTENRGVASARNTGIRSAKGRYILPLDADDLIAPSYLEKAVAIMEADAAVGIVYCEHEMFGAHTGSPGLAEYDPATLLCANQIHAGALFRSSDWQRVGGYDPGFIYGWEDWDFWISLSELNKEVTKIPEILYYYRIHCDSRDRSMRLSHKMTMMARLIFRHKLSYLRHFPLLCKLMASLSLKYLGRGVNRLSNRH